MTRSKKKRMNAAIAAVLSLGLLAAGCSTADNNPPSNAPDNNTSHNSGDPGAAELKLSYWVALPGDSARLMSNYNDSLFYQELEKRTGVSVEFQHPAVGSAPEQFNLLIASGNLPDVIETNITTYPGGPEKAIADRVALPLNDLIESHAPNLKKYLDDNPAITKEISTDSGTIYAFPAIGVGNSNASSGMVLRKDWLDELGLEKPETIDEWTTVLRAFKEQKGASSPLTLTLGELKDDRLIGAWNMGNRFYLDNGTVKYGPYEPAYKEFLTQMNAWYEEGLLDPDFSTQDNQAKDAKITNSHTGAFVAFIGGGIGKYLNAIPESAPSFDLVATQHPVLDKGNEPTVFVAAYDYRGDGSAIITPDNKNPEATVEWFDYLYSEEGNILKTFGVEGTTYEMVDGSPIYTDLITNNPEGLSVGEAMSKYLRVSAPAPGFVGDDRYTQQYYKFDQQKEAVEIFNKYYSNLENTRMPRITHTADEAQEISSIMAEIETYKDEMLLRFVMGVEPLENFDRYIAQLQSMRIERVLELSQAALERYNNR
ncbi:extracellular solute-binding protein [Paenibacillus sp. 1P07SE]|uniref:extracellular solute-binding protein n=1 Tax=Paenibacillus sp. 1P07SE TaxID=3132209 RepID=UPI0039A76E19